MPNKTRSAYSKRYEYQVAQVGDTEPLTESVITKARLVVCGEAQDVDQAREMLEMLGLLPGQETEVNLDNPTTVSNAFRDPGVSSRA